MALIVGDDFQHILRVLNTNVDGREKVRRRFRFLLVREWAFGVRMCGLFFVGFRGGEALFGIVRVSFGSNRISRRVGKMERDSRARRFLARLEYLHARMRLVRALWMLATRAKRRKKRCHSFVFFSKHTQKGSKKKGRAFMTPRACRVPRAKRFVYSPRDKRDFFSRHATGHVLSHENQRHRS